MTMTRIMSLASAYGLLINLLPTNFSGNEIGKTADAASISKVSCQNHPPITASKTGTYINLSRKKKFHPRVIGLDPPSLIIFTRSSSSELEARKTLQIQ